MGGKSRLRILSVTWNPVPGGTESVLAHLSQALEALDSNAAVLNLGQSTALRQFYATHKVLYREIASRGLQSFGAAFLGLVRYLKVHQPHIIQTVGINYSK